MLQLVPREERAHRGALPICRASRKRGDPESAAACLRSATSAGYVGAKAVRVDKPKSQLPSVRRGSCLKAAASLTASSCEEGWPRVATPFRKQSYTVTLKTIPD